MNELDIWNESAGIRLYKSDSISDITFNNLEPS